MANHKKLKKHVPKAQREKNKQTRNNRSAAIILAVLMIASLAGIALSGTSSSNQPAFTYKNYDFSLEPIEGSLQSMLVTEVDGVQLGFYSLPQDTLNLNVTGNLSFLASAQYLMFTGNPTDQIMPIHDLIRYEIAQSTGKQIGGAVLFENENYTAYPVISCLNSSTVVPVIELVEANKTSIEVIGSCVKIQTKSQDILYVRDRLIYQMVGIIN